MIVKAKRLGWDEKLTPEQEWDLDPYEHNDDDLKGDLEELTIPATSEHSEIKLCLVGGQEADKSTVTEITENTFCPTGPGGGIDPSCGKSGGNNGGDKRPKPLPPLSKLISAPAAHVDKIVKLAKREGGEYNFATIHSVRVKSGLSDEEFNSALLRAYQDGRVSLRIAEGFKPLSFEERASGFTQESSAGGRELLAYVSVRGE